jgi:heat shock protein HslJ
MLTKEVAMRRGLWWSVAVATLVLAGCGDDDAGGSVTTGADPRESIQGTWYPLEIEGYTVAPEYADSYAAAYLEFGDGEWNGSDGCNKIKGTYELDAEGQLTVTGGVSTKIGCANVPHYRVMSESTEVKIDADTLIFSGMEPTARYTRTANPAPTSSASSAESEILKKTEPSIPPNEGAQL